VSDDVDKSKSTPVAPPKKRSGWVEVLRTWGPAILAVFFIRTYIFEPFNIPSPSMVPTLLVGDYVVVNRSSYGLWVPATLVDLSIIPGADSLWLPPRFELFDWGDPERGDIIVFRYPMDKKVNYIKRVVGLAGDEIEVKEHQIFVNGVAQERTRTGVYRWQNERCTDYELPLYTESFSEMSHAKLLNPVLNHSFKNAKTRVVPEGHVFVMGDNRDHSADSRKWGFVDETLIKGKAHFTIFSWNACESDMSDKIRGDRIFQSLYGAVSPSE
jgi:signal peptidase I